MRKRVVIVGASGVFGSRLADRLARRGDVELVLAARDRAKLEALKTALAPRARGALEVASVDRSRPDRLADLRPWLVADAAGPFQGFGHNFARAAVEVGAHYVDIADSRDFVAGFPAAVHVAAKMRGVVALTGASSTPALTHAALEPLVAGWREIDEIVAAIVPGFDLPRGRAVVEAILAWVGRSNRVFTGGRWRDAIGWSETRTVEVPGLGRRWAAIAETPDLDLLPARFSPRREALFLAGLELALAHFGLAALAWARHWRLAPDPRVFATPLIAISQAFSRWGTDVGGMVVEARGVDGSGRRAVARWSLIAREGAGPFVPVGPLAAAVVAILEGRVAAPGAYPCVGFLSKDDILAQLADLPIRDHVEAQWVAG